METYVGVSNEGCTELQLLKHCMQAAGGHICMWVGGCMCMHVLCVFKNTGEMQEKLI